ncbi:MAG: hypothetical protein WC025_03970 [Candidatus Magasanikbacteria bacterium]
MRSKVSEKFKMSQIVVVKHNHVNGTVSMYWWPHNLSCIIELICWDQTPQNKLCINIPTDMQAIVEIICKITGGVFQQRVEEGVTYWERVDYLDAKKSADRFGMKVYIPKD